MESSRLETATQGPVHLDTVRSLHQTVVSLRTALEVSKNELKELKEKYEQHSQCVQYSDVIEKLTLENHVLRRKIIDSGLEQDLVTDIEISSPNLYDICETEIAIENVSSENLDVITEENNNFCSIVNSPNYCEVSEPEINVTVVCSPDSDIVNSPNSDITRNQPKSDPQSGSKPNVYKTKVELLSKFDVKIKVRTLQEGAHTETSETDSVSDDYKAKGRPGSQSSLYHEGNKGQFTTKDSIEVKTVSKENITMAVPIETDAKKSDNFDVQVKITSEENLVLKEKTEKPRTKENLNLDVDDLSLRSMSEGDNSVFSECPISPVTDNGPKPFEQESGNESEEVDDIELIFTTDDSKDVSNLQEDLVSIQDAENWPPSPTSTTHSTPVLIKFNTLDPDTKPYEPDKETSLKKDNISERNRHVVFTAKSLDLPKPILKGPDKYDISFKRSPNTSNRRLDSADSLSCEYTRGLSLDTKSSSFELGSSMDILNRGESIEGRSAFNRRFSVFPENDISKCGISEDDLVGNLQRRNTCPNPFQYRPLNRYGRPFRATGAIGTRPILRDSFGYRRDNAAQTELSALPNRWNSDGHLAHKMGVPLATLGFAGAGPVGGAPRRPAPRPAPQRSDARRVLLSDIGFTSMVPELSRSADPVWAASGRRAQCPCVQETSHINSTLMSRGATYRSPCPSIDQSNDWIPLSSQISRSRVWRTSMPDVRGDETDTLLDEAEGYVRRSIDNLRTCFIDSETEWSLSRPYIPSEARNLRLGHAVKLITPQGRVALGRVRYVGVAGGTATDSRVMVGAILPLATNQSLPLNDGTYRGRRYFTAPPHHTALFVPFGKVVMAWAN